MSKALFCSKSHLLSCLSCVRVHVYTCMGVHGCAHICVCACMCVCLCVAACVFVCACICVCAWVCVCVLAWMCVQGCMCICDVCPAAFTPTTSTTMGGVIFLNKRHKIVHPAEEYDTSNLKQEHPLTAYTSLWRYPPF